MTENLMLKKIQNKEIDILMDTIKRMSKSQLTIKTMCIISLSLIFLLLDKSYNNMNLFLISLIVLFFCYLLDAKYLKNERLYRTWYNFLQRKRNETNEWLFLMDPVSIKIILNEQPIKWDCININKILSSCFYSWSVVFFYPPILIIIIMLYFIPQDTSILTLLVELLSQPS
jgi:hypothetical protein